MIFRYLGLDSGRNDLLSMVGHSDRQHLALPSIVMDQIVGLKSDLGAARMRFIGFVSLPRLCKCDSWSAAYLSKAAPLAAIPSRRSASSCRQLRDY